MPKRKYSPQLIWAYINRYIEDNFPDRPQWQRIEAFFYVANKSGAYYLHGPKLYWDEEVGDGYFNNTDQSSLEDMSVELREVVILGAKKNREPITFLTFEEFLAAVSFHE